MDPCCNDGCCIVYFVRRTVRNGDAQEDIFFWSTSSDEVWAWDRKIVTLKKGNNKIKIEASGVTTRIDHLNVFYEGNGSN